MFKKVIPIVLVSILILSCNKRGKDPKMTVDDIRKVTDEMTELMIHDVTNPPLAARFYAYASIAGYEVISRNDSNCVSLNGLLNGYPDIVAPAAVEPYNYQLSAILAMIATAKKMQPSGKLLDDFQRKFLDSCRKIGFEEESISNSLSYAEEISKQVLKYAKADQYNRISNYPRYSASNKEGEWHPTPPGFFPPVEPYFNTVRPFMIDSSSQFRPARPIPYSKDKRSEFYRMLLENYVTGGDRLTAEEREIAAFWDCNPFALKNRGHLLVGMKKISPGAHWMGIAGIACKKDKRDFSQSMEVLTMVAIGLTDSFIGCWDEKFYSNRVRPETAIRNLIDPAWKPLLQTPPFPEYLSGHSCISSTSAAVLTHYFGDNFEYTDDVEVRYGLKERRFKSFKAAAEEAAISRFYGGIHFMDAIDNGMEMGYKVGELMVNKIKAKKMNN